MRYNKDGYNKYGLSRYEQKQLKKANKLDTSSKNYRSVLLASDVRNSRQSKSYTGVFVVFILIVLLVSLMRVLSSGQPITFTSFLTYARDIPTVNMPFKFFNDLTIRGDWGLFNWFKDFINMFTGLGSVAVFLSLGAINAILFLTYIVRFMFI